MKKILQNLVLLASTFISVACNASKPNTPTIIYQPNINKNSNPDKTFANFRGTPEFKNTFEYDLLRTKLLNAWMPMGELTEGFFPYIYRCTSNYPTVGIGTNITDCGFSLKEIPLYTKSGKKLSPSQIKSWITQTAGKDQSECRKLAIQLGYKGISHADAERLAHREAAKKVDLVHDEMLRRHGMELFEQPLPIQVLILDLAYQRGHNGVFRNAALWNSLKNKNYENTHRYVVCCTNKKRNKIKKALANLAHCCQQGSDTSTQLATLGRFNIRFNSVDLTRGIFTIANTNYGAPKNASAQSGPKNTSKKPRHAVPKRPRRGRHS